jgi:hypothetical protein
MTVFWNVELCSLAVSDWRFKGASSPDDGGSKHL